jgi:hypothetical protein
MSMSLSMVDPPRPDPARSAQDAHGTAPEGRAAGWSPPSAAPERRGPGSAEAAVSLAQVGLVGRAMMDAAPRLAGSPGASGGSGALDPAIGATGPVERVLAPWGVPMLPSEAARLAREAAEADQRAALTARERRGEPGAAGRGAAPEELMPAAAGRLREPLGRPRPGARLAPSEGRAGLSAFPGAAAPPQPREPAQVTPGGAGAGHRAEPPQAPARLWG